VASVVYFIGCGVGDPRLLTLRAAELVARLDVAYFDEGIHADLLARLPATCARHAGAPGDGALVRAATEGKRVGRLFVGDPLLAPTGEREVSEVARAGVAFEIVPGVPVLPALGAYAGIPAFRSSDASPSLAICAVAPGHESLQDWSRLSQATDTLYVLTDAACIGEIVRSVEFYGRAPATPVALVTDLATPAQAVVTCTLHQAPARAHAMRGRVVLVVGETVTQRERLRWFDARPLFGKRVLVTRAREQAASAAARLRERGAEAVVVPAIRFEPMPDAASVDAAVARVGAYDHVAFTSQNGVRFAFESLARQGKDARAFGSAKVAAIGPATAGALRERGVAPDVLARELTGEGLAEELLAIARPGARVLVLRAKQAREALPDLLRVAGCAVDVVPVYETHPADPDAVRALAGELDAGRIDAVLFTSSSTVTHLCDALGARAGELLAKTRLASIGPVTSDTARSRGLTIAVTAWPHTVGALVDALEASYRASG
jgi:uroporphyrinogen III methyltransferase/synthase